MRKLFVILTMILLSAGQVFAVNATEAVNPEAQPVIIYGKSGSAIQKLNAGADTVESQVGNGSIYVGACTVQSISVYGATAGDSVALYDTTDTTGNNIADAVPTFEVAIGANTSSAHLDAKDAPFANGIYAVTKSGTELVTVVYDF